MRENEFHWACPYCYRDTTITHSNCSSSRHEFNHYGKTGWLLLDTKFIACPSPVCNGYSVDAALSIAQVRSDFPGRHIGKELHAWKLKPQSSAIPFPEYVPEAIIADYEEACLIVDLSAKASATLSRRALQGMIRNFFGVTAKTLHLEIIAIRDKVDPVTWEAIDAVRSIGNIGAHMGKNIDLIIDVDPHEAEQLISLIGILIKDWYITRYEREQRLAGIIEISKQKKADKRPKV